MFEIIYNDGVGFHEIDWSWYLIVLLYEMWPLRWPTWFHKLMLLSLINYENPMKHWRPITRNKNNSLEFTCILSVFTFLNVSVDTLKKQSARQRVRNTSLSHLYWPLWRCTYIALSFHFSDTECRHNVLPSQGSQEALQRLWSGPKQQLIAESDWDPEHMTILQLWPEIALSTYNSYPERCGMAWCILRVKQTEKWKQKTVSEGLKWYIFIKQPGVVGQLRLTVTDVQCLLKHKAASIQS